MAHCVIKVGALYYMGDQRGIAQFSPDVSQALQFDAMHDRQDVTSLSKTLGGDVIPLSKCSTDIAPLDWLKENLSFILNSIDGTQVLLKEFMSRFQSADRRCDLSWWFGLPCELQVAAFKSANSQVLRQEGNYVCCLVLRATEKLTREQQEVWDALKYGVPLIDNRRVLVPSLDSANIGVYECATKPSRGGAVVTDTAERQAAIDEWRFLYGGRSVSGKPAGSARSSLHKMTLG